MPTEPRLNSRAWNILPLFALGFLFWCTTVRIQQVIYVSGLGPQSAAADPGSPTGYKGGRQALIVPGRNMRSFQWIAETQQMFARREWRVRHVSYDNAPFGREAHSPSPYRWWLGLVAWFDHGLFDRTLGQSVERAALIADPLLQSLLLLVTALMIARWFGLIAAAFFSLGLVTLFPLAVAFLPGAPDSNGLVLGLTLWSILPLVRSACVQSDLASAHACRQNERLFVFAGVAGGLGLWVEAAQVAPLLLGIAAGGMAVAWLGRKKGQALTFPAKYWRLWALAGAVTSLVAYFIEYFPAGLDWRPQVNHPIYGVAWLGAGELVAQMTLMGESAGARGKLQRMATLMLALVSLAALPVALVVTGEQLTFDPSANRLTCLPGGVAVASVGAWWSRDGLNGEMILTFLPLTALLPLLILLAGRSLAVAQKAALLLGLGATLSAVTLAWFHLRAWSLVDIMLLGVMTAALGARSRLTATPAAYWGSLLSVTFAALCGVFRILPSIGEKAKIEMTRTEAVSLVERDVAYWIADRAGADGATILAPPFCSTSLAYYGGFRGLGSPAWENRQGVSATIQIVSSVTGDEANGRLLQRGVTHIVLPSWDNDLDEFVRGTLAKPSDSFLAAIHRWGLPPWLRPLPYSLPDISGFEDQSLVVIQVTDVSEQWAFLARQAEYFLEMGQLDLAKRTSNALKLFPVDPSALAARVQVEKACGDNSEFNATFKSLLGQLRTNPSPALPWDRRVSLAVALALGGEADFAREQVRRCLQDSSASLIRELNTGALYRLLFLSKTYNVSFPTLELRNIALEMLPAEQRHRL